MNIEDITKAAAECRLATAQSMGVYGQYHYIDECPNHGLSCDELVEESFIKGAEWRINIVWHNTSEAPQYSGMLIALNKKGLPFICGPNHSDWKTAVKIFHIERWAYVKDLIPNTAE